MIGFPLLLIPFAIYNIFVFLMPGVAFTTPIVDVALMSGATWTPTFGDALLALGAFLLLIEVIKASRPGARYLTDHLLSLIVLGAAVAEFVLLAPFGTSTFALLTLLMAVEFLAGIFIGFRSRHRHAPAVAPAGVAPQAAPVAATAAAAAPDPAPVSNRLAPAEPSFDPVHPDPKPAEPVFDAAPQPRVEPEPHVQPAPRVEPLPEPAQKPVPSHAVVRNSESATPVPDRKIANWSVADLVSDHDPGTKTSPKP